MTLVSYRPLIVGQARGMMRVECTPQEDDLRYDLLIRTNLEDISVELVVGNAHYKPRETGTGLLFTDVMIDLDVENIRIVVSDV